MSVHLVFDAATPPHTIPLHADGVMGYLGGPRATRAWTLEEWLPFHGLRQFGIYVPDVGVNPLAQGREAVQLALALGWSDKMTGPEQRAIVLDMETSADRAWYEKIAHEIDTHGFITVAYGSLSTVLGNGADDVLAADWTGVPGIPAGRTIHGGQYEANVPFGGTLIDYTDIDEWLYQRGGVGPRRHV
jgi:hypothetical protein